LDDGLVITWAAFRSSFGFSPRYSDQPGVG
jgi:hypothetical protein